MPNKTFGTQKNILRIDEILYIQHGIQTSRDIEKKPIILIDNISYV